jgi:hypothetical protein
LGVLELVLVEQRGIEARHAERARDESIAHLPRPVWYLECAGERSGDEAKPRIGVDERRQVGEAFVLVGIVVDRAVVGDRIFQAFVGRQISPGEKVLDAGKQSALGNALVPGGGAGMVGQVLPNVPPYWIDGVMVF